MPAKNIHATRLPGRSVDILERHPSPGELASAWGLDVSTVRKIFIDREGVLKVGRESARGGKRQYLTLRIPESLARQVYMERTR